MSRQQPRDRDHDEWSRETLWRNGLAGMAAVAAATAALVLGALLISVVVVLFR
ncbi:MAG: hypothetical protein ACRDU8_08630 [Egibacteraceae bacterium]